MAIDFGLKSNLYYKISIIRYKERGGKSLKKGGKSVKTASIPSAYHIKIPVKGLFVFFYVFRWIHPKEFMKLWSEISGIVDAHLEGRFIYIDIGAQ